jgi:hypothetical protein
MRYSFFVIMTPLILCCSGDDLTGPTSSVDPAGSRKPDATQLSASSSSSSDQPGATTEEFNCTQLQERNVRFTSPGFVNGNMVGLFYKYIGAPALPAKLEIFWDEQGEPTKIAYVSLGVGEIQRTNDDLSDHVGIVEHTYTGITRLEEKVVRVNLIISGRTGNCATVRRVNVTPPSETDPIVFPPRASVQIQTSTNGFDADVPPGPSIAIGAPVLWEYAVTNTGEADLQNVTVTDDQGATVSCPQIGLKVNTMMTCIVQGTASAGQYANVGIVTATTPSLGTITDQDPSHYLGIAPTGCTPGYWKNHPDAWPPTGYSLVQLVDSVFAAAAAYPGIGSSTLLEALDFGGGPGVDGAARILLRAAVAALLNASHPGVTYPMTEAQVIASVDAALASGDRDTMLILASALDADNNLGCPLN